MLNINDITESLYLQIKKHPGIVSAGMDVEHGAYINMDPDRAPWVGIYKGPVTYSPSSLGRNAQSWKAVVSLIIVVQASHLGSSSECCRLLGSYEQKVLDAIWSDPKFGSQVDMVTGLSTDYSYNNLESDSMYHQQSTIKITAEVCAG